MLNHVLLYVIAVYVTITLALVTFDLIVEGHGSIRHPLPFNTVENSAHHRESHHTEDGLQKKHHKEHYMSISGVLYKMFRL